MALFGFGKRMKEEENKACCCGGNDTQAESCCGGNDTQAESCRGDNDTQAENCCGGNDTQAESCCGDNDTQAESCRGVENKISSIKVLGAGCKSCHEQFESAKKAVEELGLSVEVEYITDMEKVMAYGVMSMPAIVINEKVVSMGKVLKSAEVIKLLGKLGY